MAKKVAALLVAILISKSSGATDSDTQKVAAIQKRRYFSGVFNNPGYGGKFCISLKIFPHAKRFRLGERIARLNEWGKLLYSRRL